MDGVGRPPDRESHLHLDEHRPAQQPGRAAGPEVGRISPARARVVPTSVTGDPVLCGAIRAAVDQARDELLASVASS